MDWLTGGTMGQFWMCVCGFLFSWWRPLLVDEGISAAARATEVFICWSVWCRGWSWFTVSVCSKSLVYFSDVVFVYIFMSFSRFQSSFPSLFSALYWFFGTSSVSITSEFDCRRSSCSPPFDSLSIIELQRPLVLPGQVS